MTLSGPATEAATRPRVFRSGSDATPIPWLIWLWVEHYWGMAVSRPL